VNVRLSSLRLSLISNDDAYVDLQHNHAELTDTKNELAHDRTCVDQHFVTADRCHTDCDETNEVAVDIEDIFVSASNAEPSLVSSCENPVTNLA